MPEVVFPRLKRIVKRTGAKQRHPGAFGTIVQIVNPKIANKVGIRRQKVTLRRRPCEKKRTPSLTTVNSRDESVCGQSAADVRTTFQMPENDRLSMKVSKVRSYWRSQTLLIPNVFRLTVQIEFNNQSVLEYQDLSRKEVLAQNGGMKSRLEAEASVDEPAREERGSAKKKTSVK